MNSGAASGAAATPNERAERTLEQIRMTARRDTPAGVLTYAEQRALEIGITIAGDARRHPARRADGGHEPRARPIMRSS